MRGLRRPSLVPPTLRADRAAGKKTDEHREKRAQSPGCELDFPDHWNNRDVRGALFAMQGWVCAYCQRDLDGDGGDVDHFRPKNGGLHVGHDGYWWLAYRFDNYLLACRRCNEHVKREQFPVRGTARAEHTHEDAEAHEHRLLLEPTREGDSVEVCFVVDVVDDLCPVRARLRDERDRDACERVEETERLFRLNDDVDHRRPRIRARVDVINARRTRGSADEHRMKAGRFHPHSAAWRDALRTHAPEVALPTPAEEFRWLLDQMLARLNLWFTMQSEGDAEVWNSRAEEIGWALAFLWVDPPTGDSESVRSWLDEQRLTEWVDAYRRKLTRVSSAR